MLQQHLNALFTALDDVGQCTEGLAPADHATLQGVVADLHVRLQAFAELVEHCLTGANADTEARDAMGRLIAQINARQHDIQGQSQRLSAARPGDWVSHLVTLEATWSQLDKTARSAIQALTPRPRPDEASQ